MDKHPTDGWTDRRMNGWMMDAVLLAPKPSVFHNMLLYSPSGHTSSGQATVLGMGEDR